MELVGRMDDERQAIDAVATELSRETVSVTTFGIKTIGIDQRAAPVMLPYIRRIDIGDVNRGIFHVPRVHVEAENDDTIATMNGSEGIVVQTIQVNVPRLISLGKSPAHRVTFADERSDSIVHLFPDVDMNSMDAIVAFDGLFAVDIVTGGSDVIQTAPSEWYFVRADINRIIGDLIGLMDEKMQTIDTIAAILGMEVIAIMSRYIERVGINQRAALVMFPYIRRIDISDVNRGIFHIPREDIETQCNDTVASVDRGEGIIIKAAGVEETRLVCLR